MKKLTVLLLAMCLAAGGALADSWNGSVCAQQTVDVTAPASGILETLEIELGQAIPEGGCVGEIRAETAFSPADGTVAAVHAQEGDEADGTVLEISPFSLYTVTCTVTSVAKTPENALVHAGESVWFRCTADGSHRAVGVITSVSGAEYAAETTGGELYVGETVYVYRDSACAQDSLVGKGTVTEHDTLSVEGTGVLTKLYVKAGDRVERGQRLFAASSSGKTAVIAPAEGIVSELTAKAGQTVQEEAVLARVSVGHVLRIEVAADEAPWFRAGETWYYIRADDPHETCRPCTVNRVMIRAEDASATVELIPEEEDLPYGLTVTVTDTP